MSVRRLEIVAILGAAAAGGALTPSAISGDAGRVLITFLGIVAASVLPTVTLLVNSLTANGRSVHSINKLEAELQRAMDALFVLFGAVGVAVLAQVALSIPAPAVLQGVPYLTTEILPRGGQALVLGATAMILSRIGQIPGILRRTLSIRHEGALEEARLKLAANAPEAGSMRKAFATHPDFGKPVGKTKVDPAA